MEKTKNGPHPPPLPLRSRVLISSGFSWAHSPQDSHESRAFLVVQMAKDLPSMQETSVWSLSWEDPLEKGMATHSSILAWRITWIQEPDGLQSMGSQRVGSNWPICQFSEYSFYQRKSLALHFLYPASCGLDCVDVAWTSFNHVDELSILGDGRTTRSGESGPQMAWWRIDSLYHCFGTSSKRETNSLLFFKPQDLGNHFF